MDAPEELTNGVDCKKIITDKMKCQRENVAKLRSGQNFLWENCTYNKSY